MKRQVEVRGNSNVRVLLFAPLLARSKREARKFEELIETETLKCSNALKRKEEASDFELGTSRVDSRVGLTLKFPKKKEEKRILEYLFTRVE